MTVFLLVRHGETFANRSNHIQGTLDNDFTALTARGILEARQYQKVLRDFRVDSIYTSPLQRAVKTSQIINADQLLKVSVDDRLREISYGHWNGMAIDQLKLNYAPYFDVATNDVRPDSITVNNGESFNHAKRRIRSFILEMTASHPDDRVLVVTHGWVIKNFISMCFSNLDGVSFNNPRNLSLSKVRIEKDFQNKKIYYYNRQLKV